MSERFDHEKVRSEVAESLLDIGAVFLRPDKPFTWASGIRSPIYCDNRLTLTAPKARTLIEEGLAGLIREYYPDAEAVFGTSTAGIAHAAIVGHLMDIPMGYVRGARKDHGRTNRIEGRLGEGEKVVVVEDLISTGGSAIDTVSALREHGAEVLGIASIFTYGMAKSILSLSRNDVENHSLSDLDALLSVAVETGRITEDERYKIRRFRDDPLDEAWINGI